MTEEADLNLRMSCPGSEEIRRPAPEYLKCPKCQSEVEIWTDEKVAECENCGTKVSRDRDNLCINWCDMAEKCVGTEKYLALKK